MVNRLDDDTFTSGPSPFRNGATMIGVVKELRKEDHQVIVTDLNDPNFESEPLSVVTAGTYQGGSWALPDIGTIVAWTPFDYQQGIVWGRVVQKGDGKQDADKVFYIVDYSDGKTVKYDRDTNTFSVVCSIIEMNSPDVRLGENPTEPAVLGDILKAWLESVMDSITAMTHAVNVGAAVTVAPPVVTPPLKDFATLKAELNTILAQQVKVK